MQVRISPENTVGMKALVVVTCRSISAEADLAIAEYLERHKALMKKGAKLSSDGSAPASRRR